MRTSVVASTDPCTFNSMAWRITASLLVAAVLLCSVQGEDDMKEMGKVLHDGCVEEVGTPESMISEAAKGNFADDDLLKCYMKCLFTSTSIMDDDGVIDLDVMIAMIPPAHMDLATKLIEACKHITGPNACQLSYNIHLCMHKFSPEDYFII